jgi:hypothetical protein
MGKMGEEKGEIAMTMGFYNWVGEVGLRSPNTGQRLDGMTCLVTV